MEVINLSRLFIDTGAFIALICQNDDLHDKTTIFYQSQAVVGESPLSIHPFL